MSDSHRAQLDWDDQGQPLSRSFGDVYFSRASGLEETRHVFVLHNQLYERFRSLRAHEAFVIAETGFGTGLNFLCAWQAFEELAASGARLHFVSAERYPLTLLDMQRALALWPELSAFSDELLKRYRAVHAGYQRFTFAGGRVTLTLMIDDVHSALPTLDAAVDAWFLDGFAPSKNPEMWTPDLFAEMARLSTQQTTVSTFTCAGFVRRGLIDAGFTMRKVKGFGHKREMLAGQYAGITSDAGKPWFARPVPHAGRRDAIIIGAGLAGAASAASLAARGWNVTVLERHPQPASEASGNPQGVLYLKLSAHNTPLSTLVLSGFGYTRRLLEQLRRGLDWDDCGVLQLAFDDKEAKRQDDLCTHFPPDLLRPVSQSDATTLAGVLPSSGGLLYPEAGWVHPPALCKALLDHPLIRLIPCAEAIELVKGDSGEWSVRTAHHELERAPIVVIAGAADSMQFSQTARVPLKKIRGQITYLPSTPESARLRTVLCAEGYVAPARENQLTLGASFEFDNADPNPSVAEHQHNLSLLEALSPSLSTGYDQPARMDGRVAFRCTSPDYLPIVGPMADEAQFTESYGRLAKDARQVPRRSCPWMTGLYLNTAHGSRGLITAPLAGELLAAWIDGEPLPVPRAVAEACHPNRFMLRRLIRGQR
jgi:tRNA 5-methylaminomethyl-2-thiouridine biosynthesis bifunctional protein